LKNSELPIAGSKTGYLDEAGYCLLTKVKSAQDNLILINLNSSSKENNFADHEKLIRYGLKVLANQN
jgi:D-alanyl-D-alanine carboxypeptidase